MIYTIVFILVYAGAIYFLAQEKNESSTRTSKRESN